MIGSQLGPYKIEAPIGAGGMGEVFRAHDTRLHRTVAIKVLPRERIADPERKRRFLQEARAASALNHPNIVTLYDIANEEGVDYLVMEFVPGKSLDKLITPKGLPLVDDPICHSDRERVGGGAGGGNRASRHQTGERDRDVRIAGEDSGLRPGQVDRA